MLIILRQASFSFFQDVQRLFHGCSSQQTTVDHVHRMGQSKFALVKSWECGHISRETAQAQRVSRKKTKFHGLD